MPTDSNTRKEKLELKYQFFGLHLGRKVLNDGEIFDLSGLTDYGLFSPVAILSDGIENDATHHRYIKNCQLLLKPLQDISEQDAVEVAKIALGEKEINHKGFEKFDSHSIVWFEKNEVWIHFESNRVLIARFAIGKAIALPCSIYPAADFLRSKGYCLPYMGIDPVKEGWAVPENKNVEK